MQQLRIIDGAPAFRLASDEPRINWSKVDFAGLERDGRLSAEAQAQIIERFTSYAKHVRALGYTALSFDDLAHLTLFAFYDIPLKHLIEDYRALYKQLFKATNQQGLQIFINTDYMFRCAAVDAQLQTGVSATTLFDQAVQQLCADFPEVYGVIVRIGEHDGHDVRGTFASQIELRTPRQANAFLKKTLPIFEQHGKTLIFRTWTVGMYEIGDLIWNEQTFDATFRDIDSSNLIVSMKFGDTDFMRHLQLNSLFFRGPQRKLLELQTRREWEGMGLLPSFVGWETEKFLQQLKNAPHIVGVHVWSQTGGWSKQAWAKRDGEHGLSFWDELNTFVVGRLVNGVTTERAIADFCKKQGIRDVERFTKLLRLSERAVEEGLYIKEFAAHSLYFRRSRLPTLLWLTWDSVLASPLLVAILRVYVKDAKAAVREGHDVVRVVEHMVTLAKELKLPEAVIASLEFQLATFQLLADVREHLLGRLSADKINQLKAEIAVYTAHYPQHYTVPNNLFEIKRSPGWLTRFIRLAIRAHSSYRAIDRIILATSPLQRLLIRHYFRKNNPELTKQSMGIESIFR